MDNVSLSDSPPDADQVTVSDGDNVVCSAAHSRVVDNYLQQYTAEYLQLTSL